MITVFNIILISLVYMVTLDSCCCLLVISVRQKGISQVRPPESRKGYLQPSRTESSNLEYFITAGSPLLVLPGCSALTTREGSPSHRDHKLVGAGFYQPMAKSSTWREKGTFHVRLLIGVKPFSLWSLRWKEESLAPRRKRLPEPGASCHGSLVLKPVRCLLSPGRERN